jgi:hypothetical protein
MDAANAYEIAKGVVDQRNTVEARAEADQVKSFLPGGEQWHKIMVAIKDEAMCGRFITILKYPIPDATRKILIQRGFFVLEHDEDEPGLYVTHKIKTTEITWLKLKVYDSGKSDASK